VRRPERCREFERDFVNSKKDLDRRRRDQIRGQRSQLDGRLLEMMWDAHAAQLTNFLRTEAGPPIYYLPAKHNAATSAMLEVQRKQQMHKLAGSVLLKRDPLDGLDLASQPAPTAAAPAAPAAEGEDAPPKADGDAAEGVSKAGAEAGGAAEAEAEAEPVEEPMMEGTELGAMLED
jgi:hypothetical protein